jgi:hypothetical protein
VYEFDVMEVRFVYVEGEVGIKVNVVEMNVGVSVEEVVVGMLEVEATLLVVEMTMTEVALAVACVDGETDGDATLLEVGTVVTEVVSPDGETEAEMDAEAEVEVDADADAEVEVDPPLLSTRHSRPTAGKSTGGLAVASLVVMH